MCYEEDNIEGCTDAIKDYFSETGGFTDDYDNCDICIFNGLFDASMWEEYLEDRNEEYVIEQSDVITALEDTDFTMIDICLS